MTVPSGREHDVPEPPEPAMLELTGWRPARPGSAAPRRDPAPLGAGRRFVLHRFDGRGRRRG